MTILEAVVVDFPDVSPIDSAVRQPDRANVAEIFLERWLAFGQVQSDYTFRETVSCSSQPITDMASALWIGLGIAGAAFFVCHRSLGAKPYFLGRLPASPRTALDRAKNRTALTQASQ